MDLRYVAAFDQRSSEERAKILAIRAGKWRKEGEIERLKPTK